MGRSWCLPALPGMHAPVHPQGKFTALKDKTRQKAGLSKAGNNRTFCKMGMHYSQRIAIQKRQPSGKHLIKSNADRIKITSLVRTLIYKSVCSEIYTNRKLSHEKQWRWSCLNYWFRRKNYFSGYTTEILDSSGNGYSDYESLISAVSDFFR